MQGANDVAKVSAIGIGMRSHAGVAAHAFQALAEKGINIRAITTSEIKFSVLIDAAYTELAVRTLHSLYGLDQGLTRKSARHSCRLRIPRLHWLLDLIAALVAGTMRLPAGRDAGLEMAVATGS